MAVYLHEMGTELSIDLVVGALAIQMHVQLTKERSKRIGVSELSCFPGPIGHFEEIIKTIGSTVCYRFENALVGDSLGKISVLRIGPVYHRQRFCVRSESSDHLVAIDRVEAKETEWVRLLRSE
jgi:hypothetical protein